VTVRLADRGIRLILLDIEGTTTPIAFVHDVLFPFARARLATWCREFGASGEYTDIARRLAAEHADDLRQSAPVPPWHADSPETEHASLVAYAEWLMDRDRKSPGLKLLQGLIWEQGYQSGALRGVVYPDVAPAIQEWHAAGVHVAIYSSGSELAQRRLFGSTSDGDLTPFIAGFFDTSVGPKQSTASYTRILAALGQEPSHGLFVSDAVSELQAARFAGLEVILSVRPGNATQPDHGLYPAVSSFREIEIV